MLDKKVFFASASPPIIFPNVMHRYAYVKELIAYNKTIDEICDEIGADKLIYQTDDLVKAVKVINPILMHLTLHVLMVNILQKVLLMNIWKIYINIGSND